MDDRDRNEVASWLERLADEAAWNPDVWQKCHDLVTANRDSKLLKFVSDDIIHYNGLFHSRNIFGFRVKPGRYQLDQCRQEFRDIAAALRSSLSPGEAKKKYDL